MDCGRLFGVALLVAVIGADDRAVSERPKGRVLCAVKQFCEISLGAVDGISVGDEFHVYRDRTYIRRIVIRRVAHNRAVGESIPFAGTGEIKPGYRVHKTTLR